MPSGETVTTLPWRNSSTGAHGRSAPPLVSAAAPLRSTPDTRPNVPVMYTVSFVAATPEVTPLEFGLNVAESVPLGRSNAATRLRAVPLTLVKSPTM